MNKPFDSAIKELIELQPEDWLVFTGLPRQPATVIDADLATVLLEADKIIRVEGARPFLLHIEAQTTYDADMGERMLQYNFLLQRRHGLPVISLLILLRPEADGEEMTGVVRHEFSVGTVYHEFSYRVIRVWEHTAEELIAGGIALSAVAPLAQDAAANLPQVIRQVEAKAEQELPLAKAKQLLTRSFLLLGMLYDQTTILAAFEGIMSMKESVTYQMIWGEGKTEGLQEGREEEVRRVLLRLGGKRFGIPSEATEKNLAGLRSLEQLEALTERLLDVETWDELLTEPVLP